MILYRVPDISGASASSIKRSIAASERNLIPVRLPATLALRGEIHPRSRSTPGACRIQLSGNLVVLRQDNLSPWLRGGQTAGRGPHTSPCARLQDRPMSISRITRTVLACLLQPIAPETVRARD